MSDFLYKDENISIDSELVTVSYGVEVETYRLDQIIEVQLCIPRDEKRQAYKRLAYPFMVWLEQCA